MPSKKLRFIVELCAPSNPDHIPKYFEKVKIFLPLTNRFGIPSHPKGAITGFDRSYCLAKYLKDKIPSADILFHLTCKDVNFVNVDLRLKLIKSLGITKILIVTGQEYTRPEIHPELHFENSQDLTLHIVRFFPDIFEEIAVAAYPQGYPKEGFEMSEVERLIPRLTLGVTTIYAQCEFQISKFTAIVDRLEERFPKLVSIPSIAMFKDSDSLQRCYNMTKTHPQKNMIDQLKDLSCTEQKSVAVRILTSACIDLGTYKGRGLVYICPLGLHEIAYEVMKSSQTEYANHETDRQEIPIVNEEN